MGIPRGGVLPKLLPFNCGFIYLLMSKDFWKSLGSLQDTFEKSRWYCFLSVNFKGGVSVAANKFL